MGPFGIEFLQEGVELGLLLHNVGARRAGELLSSGSDACVHDDRSAEDQASSMGLRSGEYC